MKDEVNQKDTTLDELVEQLEKRDFFKYRKIGGDGNYQEISNRLKNKRINHKVR